MSAAETSEPPPSPEWSWNAVERPKRRLAQALMAAADCASDGAPEAARPTASAVMLVENFSMSRRISRRGSLCHSTSAAPSGRTRTTCAAGSSMPCARARVWKTSAV